LGWKETTDPALFCLSGVLENFVLAGVLTIHTVQFRENGCR
jgi:hypothetical protein